MRWPVEEIAHALRESGHVVRPKRGGGYRAQCPAHDDREPSLTISDSDQGHLSVVHCWAGCSHQEVESAIAALLGASSVKASFCDARGVEWCNTPPGPNVLEALLGDESEVSYEEALGVVRELLSRAERLDLLPLDIRCRDLGKVLGVSYMTASRLLLRMDDRGDLVCTNRDTRGRREPFLYALPVQVRALAIEGAHEPQVEAPQDLAVAVAEATVDPVPVAADAAVEGAGHEGKSTPWVETWEEAPARYRPR